MVERRRIRVQPKQSCPLCFGRILDEAPEMLVICDRCKTVYHRECASELGGCSTLGCGGPKPASARQRARAEEQDFLKKSFEMSKEFVVQAYELVRRNPLETLMYAAGIGLLIPVIWLVVMIVLVILYPHDYNISFRIDQWTVFIFFAPFVAGLIGWLWGRRVIRRPVQAGQDGDAVSIGEPEEWGRMPIPEPTTVAGSTAGRPGPPSQHATLELPERERAALDVNVRLKDDSEGETAERYYPGALDSDPSDLAKMSDPGPHAPTGTNGSESRPPDTSSR